MKKKNYLIVIFIVSFFAYYFWAVYFPSGTSREEKFTIKQGDGLTQISGGLKKKDLIKNQFLFILHIFLKGESHNLQAGEYLLNSNQSSAEIADKIINGEVIKEKLTIIEGWNLEDVAAYLEEKGISNRENFFELVGYPKKGYNDEYEYLESSLFSEDFDFIKEKTSSHLEGYLFPDTYEIDKNFNLEDIISRMLYNFESKVNSSLREEIKAQGKNLFEIITMASLLEKEVSDSEDKKIVSGILWKRLEEGMPLQVDATIIYLTGKKTTRVLLSETKIDSPYNTYKYRGLPPAPIANPGLDSILAAIYPEGSSFWFYLSTPQGKTIFSDTLEEHNVAKNEYLSN
jgi:UPF0755 protein